MSVASINRWKFSFEHALNCLFLQFEKKREEFRKYLECAGVIDSLSKALIKLYEEGDKPEDAVQFLRENMCETCPTDGEVSEMKDNYEKALTRISELERELSSVKGNL